MGNITETSHFKKLQEDSEQMNDTMQEDEKLVYEEQFGNKDKCNLCNDDSPYDKTEPISERIGYIEGSGQMCLDCYEKVYGHEWNRNREQKIKDEQIIFTKDKTKKLQLMYNKAVKDSAESFLFEGKEILTGFAKYLIEALKLKGM